MPDTIAAIATPLRPCAIGILRLSGPAVEEILDAVFFPLNGVPMSRQAARTMVLGRLLDGEGRILDSALCVRFSAPASYTGEDCAEIHCHGSPVVLTEGLKLLFAHGARQAKGGEFTQRAFLNGRMDLMQAEAVIDVIDAETAQAARNAAGQLEGALSRGVQAVYDTLMNVVSRFYAIVDYPDEDIEEVQLPQLLDALRQSEEKLSALLDTYSRGRLMKQGVPTVLLGKPNVGKSSLLNALVGYDRAIVTDVAGTTRDTVEESLLLGHVLLRLTDTAGIRRTDDAVERLGVERSRRAAERAALALLLLDGSEALDQQDEEAMAVAEKAPQLLVVVNKSDLPRRVDREALKKQFGTVLSVSAKTGEGMSALCEAIGALYPVGTEPQGEVLTNARQADAVERALRCVKNARASLELGMTPDVVLTDAEGALEALGELNGKQIREDLVDTIFSRFCVGK